MVFIVNWYMRKTLKYESTESPKIPSEHKKPEARQLCRFGFEGFDLRFFSFLISSSIPQASVCVEYQYIESVPSSLKV